MNSQRINTIIDQINYAYRKGTEQQDMWCGESDAAAEAFEEFIREGAADVAAVKFAFSLGKKADYSVRKGFDSIQEMLTEMSAGEFLRRSTQFSNEGIAAIVEIAKR